MLLPLVLVLCVAGLVWTSSPRVRLWVLRLRLAYRHPEHREELLRRPPPVPPLPEDPGALVHRVAAPMADRPGVAFPSAAPAMLPPQWGVDGSCGLATVRLAPGTAFLVVHLGRVGDREPAEERVEASAQSWVEQGGSRVEGPTPVMTAAGPAHRHTLQLGASQVTDWHVDRDGYAYVVGLLRPVDGGDELVPVAERMLAGWEWLPPLNPRPPNAAEPS